VFDGLPAGQGVPAEHQRGRALLADPRGQPPQVAAAGVDAHVQEPGVEPGGLPGEDDVAGQRQVHAGPDGGAGDRGDGRHRGGGQGLVPGVGRGQRVTALDQGVQGAAGAEHRRFGGQHDHPGVGGQGRADGLGETVAERAAEGVAAVGVGQREAGDTVGDVEVDQVG
jgi:hypothetical protein